MADTPKSSNNAVTQNKKSVHDLRQLFESHTENPHIPSTHPSKTSKAKPRIPPKPNIFGNKTASVRDVSNQDSIVHAVQSEVQEMPGIVCKGGAADPYLSKEDGTRRNVIDEEDTKDSGPNADQMGQQIKGNGRKVPLDGAKANEDIQSDKIVRKKKSLRRSIRSGPNIREMRKQYEQKSLSSIVDKDKATKCEGDAEKRVVRNRKIKGSFIRRMETNLCKQEGRNVSSLNKGSEAGSHANPIEQEGVWQGQTSNDQGNEKENETPDVLTERLAGLEPCPGSNGKMS